MISRQFNGLFLTLVALTITSGSELLASPSSKFEKQVTARGPDGNLAGTLIETDGTGPLILIIPGSGPTDRDGNSPLGIKASSYRLLAEALQKKNIATLRIDKRGMFGSSAAVPDPNNVTLGEYADDVLTWADAMKKRTGRNCIWLLGHSEGGLVALNAARDEAKICGLILVGAPGRKMGDILREQLKANPANAPLLPQAMSAINSIEDGKRVDTSQLHPALKGLFDPAVQGFLIDMFATDPASKIKTLNQPILILQGNKDIQVSMQDAERLASSNRNAKLVVIENMNHVLKEIETADRQKQMASYQDETAPVNEILVDAVADFLDKATCFKKGDT
ncbi:alpha/beta hydrolase [Parasphingorhabdus sp.]|uniref:alpha/beta hydrolase n=1 Tax=Parasphingorhabdus sp. TaxID=2709688 RepID=UPI003BAFC957